MEELKRRQAAGELTPEELAELERLEKRMAVLEDVIRCVPSRLISPDPLLSFNGIP